MAATDATDSAIAAAGKGGWMPSQEAVPGCLSAAQHERGRAPEELCSWRGARQDLYQSLWIVLLASLALMRCCFWSPAAEE
jgi:hypothetical protein